MQDDRASAFYKKRRKTPLLIQMEATECGAVSLGIILGYYGKFVPTEELRYACGVSRNGCDAFNLLQAAYSYGLEGHGYQYTADEVFDLDPPFIVFWEDNHFLVVEGISGNTVFLNDPDTGPRRITFAHFAKSFSNVAIKLTPGPNFKKGGKPFGFFRSLLKRFKKISPSTKVALLYLQGLLAILGLMLPVFTRIFVDQVLGQELWSWGYGLLPIMGAAILLIVFVHAIQATLLKYLAQALSVGFSLDYIRHVFRLPMQFFETRYSSEIIYRTHLNQSVMEVLTSDLFTAAISLVFMVFYLILMVIFSPLLSVLVVVESVLLYLLYSHHLKQKTEAFASLQQLIGKKVGASLDALDNLENYRLTNRQDYLFTKVTGLDANSLLEVQKIGWKDILLANTTTLLHGIALAVIMLFGIQMIMNGSMTVGTFVAFLMLTESFIAPIQTLVLFIGHLQSMRINLYRLDDVLDSKADSIFSREDKLGFHFDKHVEPYLLAKDLTFGYSPHDDPLVTDITLTFEEGKITAVMGASGAGKSTIGRMLSGLYKPWKGDIFLNGYNINELSREQLYSSVFMMDQNIFIPGGTLRDNVTLWRRGISDEEILEVLDLLGLTPLIKEVSKGLYHFVYEGGTNVSQGQKQRLQLARALLQKPKVLILDEATSNLDVESEKLAMDAIRAKGITTVFITHRHSISKYCDKIYVLEAGRIREEGTDETLMKNKGLYYQLMTQEIDE